MKFVEKNFTKKGLRTAPHRWLVALIIAPLHAAEMHYKQKYHLTFRHAKKLFLFDLALVGSAGFLAICTAVWFFYDPTITDLMRVSLSQTPTEIRSGESIELSVSYGNLSDFLVDRATVSFELPKGFIFESASPSEKFVSSTQTFTLGELEAKEHGEVSIRGRLFDTPHEGSDLKAVLSYHQVGENEREMVLRKRILFTRSSVLTVALEAPKQALTNGEVPVSITLENDGDVLLTNIELPLTLPRGMTLEDISTTDGSISKGALSLSTLETKERVTVKGVLHTSLAADTKTQALTFTPSVEVQGTRIAQQSITHTFDVVHAQVQTTVAWQNNVQALSPSETAQALVTIHNTGASELSSLTLEFPVDTRVVDSSRFSQMNNIGAPSGQLSNHPSLKTLAPGAHITLPISVPLRNSPEASSVALPVQVLATVSSANNALYRSARFSSTPLAIGTQLRLSSHALYFNKDGDQLGRGPLPPRVGQETKYLVLFEITNTTGELTDVSFSATLAPSTFWTGKTSVTQGQTIFYNTETGKMSWSAASLAPNTTVWLRAEVAVVPQASTIGTSPVLVQGIFARGYDARVQKTLERSAPAVSTNIFTDTIGKGKGVLVVE